MEFVGKYTKGANDEVYSPSLQEIKKDDYFDMAGVLQPGHAWVWTVDKGGWKGHCAMMAMLQWGYTDLGEIYKKKMKLRFATFNTPFAREVQLLLAMMRWDWMTRNFKLGVLQGMLTKEEATLAVVMADAEAMKKERDKLFDIGEIKVRIRKRRGRWCWNYLAAVHIQRWWLRKKRTFRIYKDMYQLIDGICGGNSREYVGDTPRQQTIRDTILLDIQEKVMAGMVLHRAVCTQVASTMMESLIHREIQRHLRRKKTQRHRENRREVFFASRAMLYTVYGVGPSSRWATSDASYLCEPCATTDLSYPGGGRASGSLKDPRWAAQCLGCGVLNPFYSNGGVDSDGPSCDSGPSGDEGPRGADNVAEKEEEGGWLGKWGRRLGITPAIRSHIK